MIKVGPDLCLNHLTLELIVLTTKLTSSGLCRGIEDAADFILIFV